MLRIAGARDTHASFVDDDHDHDLRWIGDRREALQHVDALEPLRRAQPLGHGVDQRRLERCTDVDTREPLQFFVGRDEISVHLDVGDDLARLKRSRYR